MSVFQNQWKMVSVFVKSKKSDQHDAVEELRANQDNCGQTIHLKLGKFLCSKISPLNVIQYCIALKIDMWFF